jgi:DNA-directed RNA polymerase subunit M/transcription elongation factor TFIIS
MNDESTRRDFLKAAGIAAAGIIGLGGARFGYTQEQEKEQEEEKKEEEPKEDEVDYEDLFGGDASGDEETRACPQCGALMYRQGRTWSCETCGYSYVE